MAKLVVEYKGHDYATLELETGQKYLIGRDEDSCAIVLRERKAISRQHASLTDAGDHWVLESLSRYGNVLVHEDPVETYKIEKNTSFRIGDYHFEVILEETKQEEAKPVEKPVATVDSEATLMPAKESQFELEANEETGEGPQLEADVAAELNHEDDKLMPAPDSSVQEKGPEAEEFAREYEHTNFDPDAEPVEEYEEQNQDLPAPVVQSFDSPNLNEKNIEMESDLDDELTASGASALQAKLVLKADNGKKIKFEIVNVNTIVGRDASCDIQIKDKLMSRRHFEINKTANHFYIVDLGSANGTKLNGHPVSKNQPQRIDSGDVIGVLNLELNFVITDVQFNNKLQISIPEPVSNPMAPYMNEYGMPMPPSHAGANVVRVGARKKPNFVKYALFVLIPMFLYFALKPSQKVTPVETGETIAASNQTPYDKLSAEQKALIRDSLSLARNHYDNLRYSLCSSEIQKIHQLVPFYENSKQLGDICSQAYEMQIQQAERARQLEERELVEKRVFANLAICKTQMSKFKTVADLKSCLDPVIQDDPSNPEIQSMINQIEAKQQKRKIAAANKADQLRRQKVGESRYRKALGLLKSKEYLKAVKAYEKYLNVSYPDPNNFKEKAQRELATAKKNIDIVVRKLFNSCKQEYQNRKFKQSIEQCDLALKEDPANSQVQTFRRKVLSELRKEMKAIYQDSILEESLGNVDAAKEKWKKIMELNISSDEYYQKAKSKLKKYGIGI